MFENEFALQIKTFEMIIFLKIKNKSYFNENK